MSDLQVPDTQGLRSPLRKPSIAVALLVVWLASISYGFISLTRYENTPGAVGASRSNWPVNAFMAQPTGMYALVLFVHPQCSCSRATLGELDRLIAAAPQNVAAYVLFERPAGMPADWEKTSLWYSAERIRGVHVLTDVNGIEARRFGALTSGQTYLYSPTGRLEFSGGITSMRGHYGDSAGRFAILSALSGQRSSYKSTNVFGCALFTTNRPPTTKTAVAHVKG